MSHKTPSTSGSTPSLLLDRRRFLQSTGALAATLAAGSAGAARAEALGPSTLTARQEASRFLAQATFGGDLALIDEVEATGPAAWLETQMALPTNPLLSDVLALHAADDPEEPMLIFYFDWTWWQRALTAPDIVRQRVTFALSQIFVISASLRSCSKTRGPPPPTGICSRTTPLAISKIFCLALPSNRAWAST